MRTTEAVVRLRDQLDGRVITPADPEYDQARRVFYGMVDRRPAAVVRPASAEEVARAVTLAREAGTELAVRSGGHSMAGHGVSEGGFVLDLGRLRTLEVDAADRSAWAQTGLTAGEYSTAVAAHGLATGFGDTGSVGLGGITLGGGVGYLSRRHGLTIDNLLAAEVVTADGEILHVDADTHPDLFWAIRGGGGNFGVATRFQFRLRPLPAVVGGMLVLPATPETVRGFMTHAQAAPEELSTIANVMVAPPMPFLPPEVHGKLVLMGLLCYAGTGEPAERALAPFRALATPLADMVKEIPYPELFPPDDPDYRPSAAGRNFFMDTVDDSATATVFEYLEKSDAPVRVAQFRALGGAIARVPGDATAYAHRGRQIMVNVAAFFQGPQDRPVREAWVDEFMGALRQGEPAAYVNFVGDDGPGRLEEVYPRPTLDRLRAVKAQYDPDNMFRLNINVSS